MGMVGAMWYIDRRLPTVSAFTDIFTPEHTDNEDDEMTGEFYISR